jgi:quercetin dioxygenase-like cupin family protein
VKPSRRDLTALLPLLAAAASKAEGTPQPSATWRFEDLPRRGKTRAVFQGTTHTGFEIELHETELGPGEAPHPPHHHVQEEMILIREGMMDVTISGKTARLGPGSVAYVASGEEHGWKNAGATQAHYFVLALRGKPA